MTSDIDVDLDGLRGCATALADTAARLRAGPDRRPPLVAMSPGWATTGAASALAAFAEQVRATDADAVAHVASQVLMAAAAYADADHRAAARLGGRP